MNGGRGCCSFLYFEFVPHWQRIPYSIVRTDLLDCSNVEISHLITELKKRTWVYKKISSTWVLYFFIIRKLFFEGTSKSSTAFFTVCHLCLTFLLSFQRHRNFPAAFWKKTWAQAGREPTTIRLQTRYSSTAPMHPYAKSLSHLLLVFPAVF